MAEITIAGQKIGDGHPTWVIAEAGINHQGSPGVLARMIRMAAECGADAVKGQKRTDEALSVLQALRVPTEQQNERSALTLLALLDIKPRSRWAEATVQLR